MHSYKIPNLINVYYTLVFQDIDILENEEVSWLPYIQSICVSFPSIAKKLSGGLGWLDKDIFAY